MSSKTGRKPGGGWDEDDEPSTVNKIQPSKPVIVPLKPSNNPTGPYTVNASKKEPEKKITYEIESKAIEDILKPSGVTVKPSDSQLSEFIKRIKTFNKEVVFKLFLEKLSVLGNFSEDQNQIKALMKALYVVENILQKKVEEYVNLFAEKPEIFTTIETNYLNHKKVCDITNSILILLGERKQVSTSSNSSSQKSQQNNNVNLLEEIMGGGSSTASSQSEETFSGLEIRNKPNNSTSQVNNSNGTNNQQKPNAFTFIKSKSNVQVEESKNTPDKELFGIFDNSNKQPNNQTHQKVESNQKTGFTFIKTKPQTQTDELSSVFSNLNVVNKGEVKKQADNNNINQTLQETLGGKIDLDKLYLETNNHNGFQQYHMNHFMNGHPNTAFINSHPFPGNQNITYGIPNPQMSNFQHNPQYGINSGPQNPAAYQNYLSMQDLSGNVRLGDNYVPLDMKDYMNQQQNLSQPQQEPKNEKDHFDFVNDLMKKKK